MASLHRILNQDKDSSLATVAELANTFWSRGNGLMFRKSLPADGGMILFPSTTIHMFFMRFPLDVLFVDRQHKVVGLREKFPRWHPFAGAMRARYVVELPIGAIAASQTEIGDTLSIVPPIPGF